MRKGWIITKDYISDGDDVGVTGPKGCTLKEEELKTGHKFKMYDDDNNLCYEGHLFGNKNSYDGFLPLDNFGEPNAGCTRIEYKNDHGEWEML